MGVFPGAPFPGGEITDNRIGIRKHLGIAFDRPEMPKLFRDGVDEALPLLRKHASNALGDPLHFATRRRSDGRQHHCIDPMGIGLAIGQPERAAPRQPENGPPIDTVQLTQRFDIGNQVRCRIGAEIGIGIACQRPATARAALIEQHRLVTARVEEAPLVGRTTRAGTTMEEESGPAGWLTAALPVDAVLAAGVEHPTVVWLNPRKLTRHGCDGLSTRTFVCCPIGRTYAYMPW